MPGFTFPPVGRLGLTSPPSRPLILHGLRYYVPLRLPLHHPSSLRSTLVRRYLASPLSFVCLQSGWRPPACLAFLYTDRRFGFVSHEELTVLSSSQATPLCTCPVLSLRWCPLVCHSTARTHTFQRIQTVGFPRHHNGLSMLSI